MENELKEIKHDLQTIKTSQYEQSLELETSQPNIKNRYFKPRERNHQCSVEPVATELSLVTTLFDLFAFELDRNSILNKELFKTEFKKRIDDDSLRAICKQHKVLKKDLHAFIDAEDYIIPSNQNVILFFANAMKTHLFVVENSKYFKNICEDNEVKKVAIIQGLNIGYRSSIETAEAYLVNINCIDSIVFEGKTKFSYIKEYIKTHKIMIPLIDCKNRTSLLNYLRKLYV